MSVGETRTANKIDVAEIGRIIGSVWPDSSINSERIVGVLNDADHSTMVFVTEGIIAGFVDGFLTTSIEGVKRWELDLLAVHPDFQRRGIASALVTANAEVGKSMGAEIARGLVAVDNVGSQRAFTKCGYKTDGVTCELRVAVDARLFPAIIVGNDRSPIIAVRTINYIGLWVEGEQNKIGLAKGLIELSSGKYDLVGAVLPTQKVQNILDSESMGFEKVGRYQWWQRPLR